MIARDQRWNVTNILAKRIVEVSDCSTRMRLSGLVMLDSRKLLIRDSYSALKFSERRLYRSASLFKI